VDPPRIDQLLSQGYGVFGKIRTFLEENEETVTELFNELPKALTAVTKFLKRKDWNKVVTLIDNVNGMTSDIRIVTKKFRNSETQEVIDKLYEMIDRAHRIDKETLKNFLQKEGIRARIF